MLKALRRLGVPQHFIEVLSTLYRDSPFLVRDRFGTPATEPQANGLRQVDGISSYLFICLVTIIMLDAEDVCTQMAEERNFIPRDDVKNVLGKHFSLCADDFNLLRGYVRTNRCMLHSIQKYASYYGSFLNVFHPLRSSQPCHAPTQGALPWSSGAMRLFLCTRSALTSARSCSQVVLPSHALRNFFCASEAGPCSAPLKNTSYFGPQICLCSESFNDLIP